MLAVIKTGGKQYIVSPDQKLRIEKLEIEEGKTVEFDEVLLIEKSDKIQVGNPMIKGAKVTATVIKTAKDKKITIIKFKRKTRYRVKRGHRQFYTDVKINKIEVK